MGSGLTSDISLVGRNPSDGALEMSERSSDPIYYGESASTIGRDRSMTSGCRSCAAGLAKRGARKCPECGHVFRGRGWDGIDAHWRAHHEHLEPYESFFTGLCPAHRRAKAPLVASGNDLKNEGKTVTRFFAGRVIRAVYRRHPGQLILELTDGSRLIVDQTADGLELLIQE